MMLSNQSAEPTRIVLSVPFAVDTFAAVVQLFTLGIVRAS
jgi:hypothetical protein